MALGIKKPLTCGGGLAQMVERSLSMREVLGSIPGSSKYFFFQVYLFPLCVKQTAKLPSSMTC